jgi:SAM-dependent methyltransferase
MSERFEQHPELKTVSAPDFFREQILLPRESWSAEFQKCIQQKITEDQQFDERWEKMTVEQKRLVVFDRYLKGLDLSVESIKDKKIIDLGSGDGEFVSECLDQGITKEVYGIDIEDPMAKEKYVENFFRLNFAEPLPVTNADYVFAYGSLSAFQEDNNLKKNLGNALSSIKSGGELRIYPIHRSSKGSGLIGIEESYQRWNDLLEQVSTEQKIEWKLKPIDMHVAGKNNDVWLEELLVIKKP